MAVWAWGEPRATQDLDVVVDIPLASIGPLSKALDKRGMVYPFPPAYMTFGDYYKAVGNKALREEYLLAAVEAELRRVLPHRWNFRDRILVSWTDYLVHCLD